MTSDTVNASPSAYKINVPNVLQEQTNWCWAASSVSCLAYSGITGISQTAFVTYVKGSNVNQGGSILEVKSGLTHYGASWLYSSVHLSLSDIILQIYNNKRPIIAGIHASGDHMVVIKGYVNTSTEQKVCYMDPWYGTEKTKTYSTFSSTWDDTLYNIH